MTIITDLFAREILDSRGFPTVEVDVILENGIIGRASVPSGASTGKYEAHERRDLEQRYLGKGVKKVVHDITHIISKSIYGISIYEQRYLDKTLCALDGTSNKSVLGANAILGVSLAVARAASLSSKMPLYRYLGGCSAHLLPVPMMNVLNGGMHADNGLSMQEFMIVPIGASSFCEAVQIGFEVYAALKSELKAAGHTINIGDEGGFAPNLTTTEEALDYLVQATQLAGFNETQVRFALDCAASNYFRSGLYHVDNKSFNCESYLEYLKNLIQNYPIFSIEDSMDEDDWNGWKLLTDCFGDKVQLVGDDLFVTNKERLSRGVAEHTANAILVKINQIGTITETLDVVQYAKSCSYNTIISHRSGETEDTFIADLSVAVGSGQIKTGAPARSDRTSKYNQLIRIEEELGNQATYAGNMISDALLF